jgi:hypothetical protein
LGGAAGTATLPALQQRSYGFIITLLRYKRRSNHRMQCQYLRTLHLQQKEASFKLLRGRLNACFQR